MIKGEEFYWIKNVLQTYILAASATDEAKYAVYNLAVGDRTTFNTLVLCNKNGFEKKQYANLYNDNLSRFSCWGFAPRASQY